MSTSQTNRSHGARGRTPAPDTAWDVLLDLGPDGSGPRHVRLTRAIREAVRSGRLPQGSAVPPSRMLADTLGCSRWVVTEAYGQLVAEGYLEARTGSATRVAAVGTVEPGASEPIRHPAPRLRHDLAPGVPDLRAFPRSRWVDAVRLALATAPTADLAAAEPLGHPGVRAAVAGHIGRTRAAVVDPAVLMVTTGARDAMVRLGRALLAAGHRTLAVEDPSWPPLRATAEATGLQVVPVPVDEQGVRVDALAESGARAVLVTPAHQFPTGVVLSARRREELLTWAREVDGLVVEDDYDAEFRYDRRPVAALQGMDPSRVVLLGSVSKTLVPGIGLGWMLTPPDWAEQVVRAAPTASPPGVIDQLALLELVERGWYDRHLRSVRRRYRARRDGLLGALADQLPGWRPAGTAAGLHFLLHLPEGRSVDDATAVARTAAECEVAVADLGRYEMERRGRTSALVIGYGNLADSGVRPAVTALARAARQALP